MDLRQSPFRRFAAELGVLFQIVDDILDVTGTDDALGKPRGSDERHGKRTYVSEFGIDRASELAAESHRTAREALAEVASRAPGADATASSSRSPTSSTPAPHEPARGHRRPRGPARPLRGGARTARPGGARAHHRHGRRDRRALRRQPRHLRAGGGAALACSTPRATRSSGTSATRPTRTRSSPAGATSSSTIRQYGGLAPFCSIAESPHDIMGAGHASTSIGYAVGIKEGMRHARRRARREGRGGDRRRRDDRRRGLRGDRPGRAAWARRSWSCSTTTACRSRRTSARCRATSTACG